MVCDICFKDISYAELFQVKDDELTAKYFSMLSQKDIDRLKQVYRKDFEMFGYTWPWQDSDQMRNKLIELKQQWFYDTQYTFDVNLRLT